MQEQSGLNQDTDIVGEFPYTLTDTMPGPGQGEFIILENGDHIAEDITIIAVDGDKFIPFVAI